MAWSVMFVMAVVMFSLLIVSRVCMLYVGWLAFCLFVVLPVAVVVVVLVVVVADVCMLLLCCW